jgi:hypothetical protein
MFRLHFFCTVLPSKSHYQTRDQRRNRNETHPAMFRQGTVHHDRQPRSDAETDPQTPRTPKMDDHVDDVDEGHVGRFVMNREALLRARAALSVTL